MTGEGVLKIVDFGVAKLMTEGRASAGLPLGTAAYMSPEQTRGEALDHRTDIWSMGIVLYEMLSGARPFCGAGEALIHAIRRDPPPPLSDARRDLPGPLAACVERCLEKGPERRHQTAEGVARELRRAMDTAPGSLRRPHRRRRVVAAAAVTALVLTGVVLRSDSGSSPLPRGAGVALGIAVLPFEIRGEDLEVWREGMVDLLSINLDGAAGFRAIDSRTVLAAWRERGTGVPDLDTGLEVARSTGANYAVTGSVVSNDPGCGSAPASTRSRSGGPSHPCTRRVRSTASSPSSTGSRSTSSPQSGRAASSRPGTSI